MLAPYIYIYIYRAIISSSIILILSVLIGLTGGILHASSAFATSLNYNVTIDPSLTVDLEDNLVRLDLNPASKTFNSQNLDVTVSTNNATGYYMTMSTLDNSTNLINTDNNDWYIETLPSSGSTPDCSSSVGGCNESTFPAGRWGYKIGASTTNYLPFVSGITIAENNTPIVDDTTTLTFASKVDYDTKAGLYATTIRFTAISKPVPIYMQYITPAACTTTPLLVTDIRDNQEYYIQRLDDGKCWMMSNLNLGAYDLTEDLTSENTNLDTTISASTFNGWRKNDFVSPSYTQGQFVTITNSNSATGSDTDPVTGTLYGTLYNYCAASANSVCLDNYSSPFTASYSLCPAGWKMPYSTKQVGEFNELMNSGYNTYEKLHASMADGGAAFAYSGIVNNGGVVQRQGVEGIWWATRVSTIYGWRFWLNPIEDPDLSTATNFGSGRMTGRSVRCLLQE